jgi:amino acid transporter
MTAASRLLFAMARDNSFLAAKTFRKISANRVPLFGIWLVALVATIFTLLADSVTSLYGAVSVLAALVYLITIVSFAVGAKHLPSSDSFSLGIWRWPVIILSCLWLFAEIGLLTIPEEFHTVALATFIVVVTGAVLYPIIGRHKGALSKL